MPNRQARYPASQLLQWLSGGDLRSDGLSAKAAEFVLANPQALADLLAGLRAPDDVIRARTADALEKIARARPDLLIDHLAALIQIAESDAVPMVRMHIAMLLGHLAMFDQQAGVIRAALLRLLADHSVFVRSWAIASLCILGRQHPGERGRIVNKVAPLQGDSSAAIRSRARKALLLLTDEGRPFPKGWIKSEHLKALEGGRRKRR